MAEAAAGAVVQVLVQNLISLLSGEIKLVRGFEGNLAKLKQELSRTQEFLSDAEDKEIKDKAAEKWLKDLEDVAFEADAVLDEFNYHLIQKKLKNQNRETAKKVWCSFSSGSISLLLRRRMARKIYDLNNKLENLNKEAVSKGLEKTVVKAPDASTVGLDQETNSYSIEPNFVGREGDVAEIVKMVLNAPAEEKISVIPIVGMGGLGKTSLTQQIYNHEKIESRFEKKIWICVSLKFDELTLFQNIHSTLTRENVQLNVTTEVVLQKIHKLLDSKRYLMILDDVWNVDSKKWEDFRKSLLGISNATQNVIVVTTRQKSVASLVETLPHYELKGLSDDDCWSIIKAKATTKEKALSSNDGLLEYEEIGKQFAQKCGGLPLVAHVIGGLLRNEPKIEWSSILKNELPNFQRDGGDHVMRILKLSYNRLPSPLLKKCFAYCTVFPQDFNIKKETLIEQWMGEGFLQTNQENVNFETIGNKIFNHLLQVSLFQESKRDDLGNITHCRMHDYVHDLACLVSGGRSRIVKDSGTDMTTIRYIYLQSGRISKERAKYLRTLIFDGEAVDHMFPGYSRLRFVTLTNLSIQELPIEIEKQMHMRFLDISNTNIPILPDSINKLSNLQTLVATNLIKLPNTIIKLLNLRHLHISSIVLPPFIGKLTSLQTLPYYKVGHDSGCRISELENLKNLKGSLEIQNLERVKDKGEAEQADLLGKPGILTLVLDWTRSRKGDMNDEWTGSSEGDMNDEWTGSREGDMNDEWTGSREGDMNDKSVLEGLQPHSNLKSLKIRGYGSINFPSWAIMMTVYNAIEKRWAELTNLVKIGIKDCQCEKVPNLGHLPCLKFLKLENLPTVQSIGLSFYGLDDCSTSTMADDVNIPKTTSVFPTLQKLYLSEMPNLKEWVNVESRVTTTFPCLEYLEVGSCPQLESAPIRFPCLKELKIDEIGSNVCLTNICANTSSLQTLEIRSYSGIIFFGDECFVKNRDLSHLVIRDCPNIISSELQQEEDSSNIHFTLPSLKHFEINNCPELKSIPHNFDFSSLEELYISNCPELKSIPNVYFSSLRHLVVENCQALTCLPFELRESSSIEYLYVRDLPNVENMDDVMSCISRMSSLEMLSLIGLLPQWTNSSAVFCKFPKLLYFVFSGFSESLDTVSFNDHLKRILHQTPRLRTVSIIGNEELGSLPDHIQHLHSLQQYDCGIEALPEWIGNLSSLRELWITNCKRLAHLPSRKAMQHITKLYINKCPLLTDKLRTQQESTPVDDDDNSEWAKISHIQSVYLDGKELPTRNSSVQSPVQDENKFAGCFPIPRIRKHRISFF